MKVIQVEKNKETKVSPTEVAIVCLLYIGGMGAILYGALSVKTYNYLFIILGALLLVYMIVHTFHIAAMIKNN